MVAGSAVVGLVLVLSGCGSGYHSGVDSQAPPQSPGSPISPATSKPPRSVATAGPDDLKTGNTARTLSAGRLTINASYSTTLSTKKWTPSASKPLAVSLSALDNGKSTTKIYLSRVTLTATPADGSGPIGNPVTVLDSANINPGYLVNFPYTYQQVFTVPAVDEGAITMELSFKYEFLSAVSDATKDYTKQTAVSTIQVPLA